MIDMDSIPYELDLLIATGGTSEVWQARGPEGQLVALKVARDEDRRPRLRREVEILERGGVPGLPRLVASDPDGAWLAQELVDGEPLDVWADGRPVADLLAVAVELLYILRRLHRVGVLHGDLKPANVLVDGTGAPRLLDLSAVARIGGTPRRFQGTLGYTAPERLAGEPLSAATDLYGFGALLYRCLTGRVPLEATDPAAMAYLPLVTLPPPPAMWRPDLAGLLDQIVLALLTRTPARRPDDIPRLAKLLTRAGAAKPASPVLGMADERDRLRRAVVAALDGEPRAVVVYGPSGTGRRTLVTEAVEAARREGMPYLKGVRPNEALQRIAAAPVAPVLVLRANQRGAQQLARAVLSESHPALLLLHADHPIPSLARAEQLTPVPLSLEDFRVLAAGAGVEGADLEAAWRGTAGLPAAARAAIGRLQATAGHEVSWGFLSREARTVLKVLREREQVLLPDLAAALELSEHAVLDHAEVLIAGGLAECSLGGAAVRLVQEP